MLHEEEAEEQVPSAPAYVEAEAWEVVDIVQLQRQKQHSWLRRELTQRLPVYEPQITSAFHLAKKVASATPSTQIAIASAAAATGVAICCVLPAMAGPSLLQGGLAYMCMTPNMSFVYNDNRSRAGCRGRGCCGGRLQQQVPGEVQQAH